MIATKWDGERFDFTRTLPASTIGSRQLTGAGQATVDGETIAVFYADNTDTAPWELVSQGSTGWDVWRPESVLTALGDAGAGAVVAHAELATWNDSCLGTHPHDAGCLQVITPGYRVIVDANGKHVEYHTDEHGHVVRLDAGNAPHD